VTVPSDETIRGLILDQFGDALDGDEVERLLPLVRRQYQVSEQLAAIDLGGLDPRGTQYITDRRLTP
jgi:hypothetical protein